MPKADIFYINKEEGAIKVIVSEPKWINRFHMAVWFIFHGYIEVKKRAEIEKEE